MRAIAYDPWNATQTATELLGEGFPMVEVRQGFASLSEPSKEFERLVVSGKAAHTTAVSGGAPALNPVQLWMMSNVTVRRDPAGNIKPDKSSATNRIDGVVSAIMALGRAQVTPVTPPPDYGNSLSWL